MTKSQDSPFKSFRIHTSIYKSVNSHPMKVDIWLPHTIPSSISTSPSPTAVVHPLILFIHGGFWVTGHRAFEPFINSWLPRFASTHNAIVVSPDYRLLPEANGTELLEDLEDAWRWIFDDEHGLRKVLDDVEPDVKVDVGRLMVTGGSAGGFGAVHLCLNHPKQVKALLLQYPMVEIECDWLVEGPGDGVKILGMDCMPLEEFEALERDVEERRRNKVAVTEAGFERMQSLIVPALCYGRLRVWLGYGDVDPFQRIREKSKESKRVLPERIYLLHGTEDSAVPVESTRRFEELLRDHCSSSDIEVDYFEGKNHGCDDEGSIGVIWPRLEWIAETWLA